MPICVIFIIGMMSNVTNRVQSYKQWQCKMFS